MAAPAPVEAGCGLFPEFGAGPDPVEACAGAPELVVVVALLLGVDAEGSGPGFSVILVWI